MGDAAADHLGQLFTLAAAGGDELVEVSVVPTDFDLNVLDEGVDYVIKPFDFEEVRLRLVIHLKTLRPPEPTADLAELVSPADNASG